MTTRFASITLVGLLLCLGASVSPLAKAAELATQSEGTFSYPIANPFLATIAGTPRALAKVHAQPLKLRTAKLPEIEDREIPKALWYARRLEYSWAMQKGSAPLIFTIAGTGGYHDGGTNKILMEAFFNAGYHVVGITSPSHPEFIVAQSSTAVPCLLYTSPSPRDQRGSRMPSSA